ncbi:hypothetical protein AcV7_004750 [Taiwanofungus camphoratus]|nr:hypothetical protein AcV7_004750 [Antrodia cinnamomea]
MSVVMLHTFHKHYVLPNHVVHTGIFTLVLSLLLNTIGTFVYKSSEFGLTSPSTSNEQPSRLPLNVRSVAMEVVDSNRYGMHDDNDWASAIPFGHGFVRLGEDDAYYAVSMYHQMHCLNSFRKMFNGHRNASRAGHDSVHALHCLTYLRQMVLCGADVTLEPAFATHNVDGRQTQAAYGTGVTHECGDWVQVREFVENNYEGWKDDDHKYVATEASAIE